MKKLFLCALLCLACSSAFSLSGFKAYHTYHISELSLHFEMGHKLLETKEIVIDGKGKLFYEEPGSTKESMTKAHPVNMIVRIKGSNEAILKEIELAHNDVDIDLSGFSIHYVGSRKFLVFTVGRYSFYMINLSNFRLIGPLYSGITGEASDSQDGTLSFIEVFNDGQYLIGYAWGFGIFCYNLMDLYNPVIVDHICTEQYHNHPTYFFLDHRIDNIYNGIVIQYGKTGQRTPAKFLFRGARLDLSDQGELYSEIVDDRYIRLKKIADDGSVIPIQIDFIAGTIVE